MPMTDEEAAVLTAERDIAAARLAEARQAFLGVLAGASSLSISEEEAQSAALRSLEGSTQQQLSSLQSRFNEMLLQGMSTVMQGAVTTAISRCSGAQYRPCQDSANLCPSCWVAQELTVMVTEGR